MPNLTQAQKRALAWLPADGGWRFIAASTLALESLHRLGLVDWTVADHRPEEPCDRFRLTPTGIALRAEMETGNG